MKHGFKIGSIWPFMNTTMKYLSLIGLRSGEFLRKHTGDCVTRLYGPIGKVMMSCYTPWRCSKGETVVVYFQGRGPCYLIR